MRRRTKPGQLAGRVGIYAILLVGAVIMMIPFIYSLSTSFKENIYVFELPPQFIPEPFTWQNYVDAWTSNHFAQYFGNSLKVAILTVALVILVATTGAYAFARLSFPGKEFWFLFYLVAMMIPSTVLILPQFVLAKTFGVLNSLWGLVIIYVAGAIPFQTFLLRGFFEGIPREIEESAVIDGAGYWTVYARLILPLAKPALGTAAIFAFLGSWDEFTWALTAINDVSLRTLPIAVRLFQGEHASQWGLVFAASMIAILPVLVVFVTFQRYFIKGLAAGAIKG